MLSFAFPSAVVSVLPPAIASAKPVDVALATLTTWVLLKALKSMRKRVTTTKLKGPPSASWIWGVGRVTDEAEDSAVLYEKWEQEYGVAYQVPAALGINKVILCDPKALAHLWARDTVTYDHEAATKKMIDISIGKGVIWAHGDSHKRQRKALTPAFSHAALRRMTSVFLNSAYKVRDGWHAILDNAGDGSVIEVQKWMSGIALDSIGLAGFSHDFGATTNQDTDVVKLFHSVGGNPTQLARFFTLLGVAFPWLAEVPIPHNQRVKRLATFMEEISGGWFERSRQEKQELGAATVDEKSVLGLLLKAEVANSELRLSHEEIIDEMKVLLSAGFETSSTTLTWTLAELSKNPTAQEKLREELLGQFANTDPTYDDLNGGLPYLDAVVHEVLRLHPPVAELQREALEDDVIPLGAPIQDANGRVIDSITIAKGTLVFMSVEYLNRSEKFWGPDAKVFRPERWLEGGDLQAGNVKANELRGHKHLLTFNDGPRTCLGKNFALAELKASLSVLVRNFAFEPRDKKDRVERIVGNLVRPKVVGQPGIEVPLRVRRVD
ncbi:cytochrome P450 [Coniophora puteana RWD-64-598 SS2]|uniref:Cytochrome P450 n=1 Tax=Coniophora puteana (strain RWD-64-598) TaxID=741705 RepID=A0A5M3MSZ6_CONPW|nr:cytochrome P450 [Coniophora puteana RWD-64-598 SS2]EIW82167.1 cytochrome P450 [Coniophora puteana RWD-64-598 SS2]